MERQPLLPNDRGMQASNRSVDFSSSERSTNNPRSVEISNQFYEGPECDKLSEAEGSHALDSGSTGHVQGVSTSLLSSSKLAYGRRATGISDAEALLHIVKGNIGPGIIGLPYAFMFAGLAVGVVSMTLICVLSVYCMLMLIKSSHHLCDLNNKQKMDYATTAEYSVAAVLPRWGLPKLARYVVNGFLIITQLGFTAIYFVFMAENMQQVLLAMRLEVHYQILIAIFIPIMIVGVWVKDLKRIAIFSGIGNILQTVSLLIIIVYLCLHLEWQGTRLYPEKVTDMALFFGLAIFCVEGIGAVLPLENGMKKPRHFPALLTGGMSFVSTLLLLVGSLGYVCFQDQTEGSITLNLPGDAVNPSNIPFLYVKLFFTFAVMSSFLVQFYVAIEIIEPFVTRRVEVARGKSLVSFVLRAVLVAGAAGLAAGVPDLGLFISLVGAVGSSALAIIFPPLINLAVFWYERSVLWKVGNAAVSFLGIIGMVAGTFATIVELQNSM